MYRALVPSAAMETLISTVSPGVLLGTGGSSKQPYGCLHARIEVDLRRNAMWNEISKMHFAWLAARLREALALPGDAKALYVAVDRDHCDARDRAAIAATPEVWPNVPSMFGGASAAAAAVVAAAKKTRSSSSGEEPSLLYSLLGPPTGGGSADEAEAALRAPILGAIVDKVICSRAEFFVGWPGSTFTNTIAYARLAVEGKNRKSNFYYNPSGVHPRVDDGRRVSIRSATNLTKAKG